MNTNILLVALAIVLLGSLLANWCLFRAIVYLQRRFEILNTEWHHSLPEDCEESFPAEAAELTEAYLAAVGVLRSVSIFFGSHFSCSESFALGSIADAAKVVLAADKKLTGYLIDAARIRQRIDAAAEDMECDDAGNLDSEAGG